MSRSLGIAKRVDELLDCRGELSQRFQDHEINRLVRALPDPPVRAEPEDLQIAAVDRLRLPRVVVINLRAVAQ